MSNSSSWLSTYTKLQFFTRIRRLLRSKTTRMRCQSSDQFEASRSTVSIEKQDQVMEIEEEDDTVVLQRSVKKLNFGRWEEKEMAAKEIERLAKEDVKKRKVMAGLGVVPVLVAMAAAAEVDGRRRVALRALIELANGTYTNKALMVEAGLLSKLPNNINAVDESTCRDFAELILSLSSLANTNFPLASSQILPFLVSILESDSNVDTQKLCLGALHNLSNVLDNAEPLVSNGVVHTLLTLSSSKILSAKALATLGNLVVTVTGKKAMENSSMVPGRLIEILTWDEEPKCQELSAYILMILAHQSSAQRDRMLKAGIVPALLELALLGSPLAQKRAMKLLQWFKDERQAKMGPHSGPQAAGRRIAIGSPENRREEDQEGKKMMKNLVKQSLDKNMEMIMLRANAAGECSKVKALVISTSSKSLPY